MERSKVKYLISNTKSISKIFIPNFVCVLTNERYKTYQMGFSFCGQGHVPWVGLWGAGGAKGVKNAFQTWSCGISNRWGEEQNRMQVKFSSYGQTGDLGVRSKGQISLNLVYHVNFKDFLYQTLCVFLQMKDTKHIRQDFHSVTWVPRDGTLGCCGCPGGRLTYQIDGDEEQNRMQVKFSS